MQEIREKCRKMQENYEKYGKRKSLQFLPLRPSRSQMFFHLVERHHADPGLGGLGGEVFQAALGGDLEEDFLAAFEESERAPGGQADAGAGAEGAAEVGEGGEAQAG